jgi:hypothetical protein
MGLRPYVCFYLQNYFMDFNYIWYYGFTLKDVQLMQFWFMPVKSV